MDKGCCLGAQPDARLLSLLETEPGPSPEPRRGSGESSSGTFLLSVLSVRLHVRLSVWTCALTAPVFCREPVHPDLLADHESRVERNRPPAVGQVLHGTAMLQGGNEVEWGGTVQNGGLAAPPLPVFVIFVTGVSWVWLLG